MANRKAKSSRLDIAHRPPPRVNEYLKADAGETLIPTREEPWAAGFVTSEGTHIPLFVRPLNGKFVESQRTHR